MPEAHDFTQASEYSLNLAARSFVALVDLESYPAFISEKADRLDLLQHLCHQMEALSATMWEVPAGPVNLQLHWQPDDSRRAPHGLPPLASGTLRTSGRLALLNDEILLAAARNPQSNLARRQGVHQLELPAGIYTVSIRNAPKHSAAITYAVTLNHHPYPPPRLHPVRLGGLARPLASYLTPESDVLEKFASHKVPR